MVVVWQRLCHGDGEGGASAVKFGGQKTWPKKRGGGAKVEGDGVDVMMAAGWGEAGDAVVYDDGGRRQVAGVWSDSGDGAGVISERVCVCVRL
ncbi:hypothetical protein Tco_0139048 [Tanacetum coccineum]